MIELPICCSFIFFGALTVFALKELFSKVLFRKDRSFRERRSAEAFEDDDRDLPEWEHDLGKKEVIEDMEFDPLKYGWDER